MNQTEELRQAITDLFLTGTDDDHDEDELLDLLEEVDFDAVRQALVTESRRIFEFEVASQADDAMNYRSCDLFGMNALLLERCVVRRNPNVYDYSYELFLLEDFTFAVTSCYQLNIGCGVYYSAYRTVKAYDWRESPLDVDFVGVSDRLIEIGARISEHGFPLVEG